MLKNISTIISGYGQKAPANIRRKRNLPGKIPVNYAIDLAPSIQEAVGAINNNLKKISLQENAFSVPVAGDDQTPLQKSDSESSGGNP